MKNLKERRAKEGWRDEWRSKKGDEEGLGFGRLDDEEGKTGTEVREEDVNWKI